MGEEVWEGLVVVVGVGLGEAPGVREGEGESVGSALHCKRLTMQLLVSVNTTPPAVENVSAVIPLTVPRVTLRAFPERKVPKLAAMVVTCPVRTPMARILFTSDTNSVVSVLSG